MSVSLAYHASHEQFPPSELLQYAIDAEAAGFDAVHSSDHFHPWSVNQGHSGFAFSWIAAAMQATTIPFSMVCAPGQRYHVAIAAQAIATLSEMFPGRYNVELASGEALNESITGEPWPSKDDRNKRLLECVSVIRRLLNGEEVSFDGTIHVREAKIYSLPTQQPKLFCAAISEQTSGWAGQWADGLLTTAGDTDEVLKKKNAFESNGGAGKPVALQYSFSYGQTEQEALDGAYHQWRSNVLPPDQLADLYKPEHFDNAAKNMTRKDMADKMPLITNMEQLFAEIRRLADAGADLISLHNVNRNHTDFINAFAQYKRDWNRN